MKTKKLFCVGLGVLLAFAACLLTVRLAFAEKPSVKPVGQVFLVDSKGKTMGHVVGGLGLVATVLLKIGDRLIGVGVTKASYLGISPFYSLPNCEGTVWLVSRSDDSLMEGVAIGPPANTAYVPQANVVPLLVPTQSGFSNGQCVTQAGLIVGVPAQPLASLDAEFTAPFSLRAAP